jgi:hypothetical protein
LYAPAARVLPEIAHRTVLPTFWPVPLLTAHCVAGVYGPLLVEISHSYENNGVPDDGIVPVTVSVWAASIIGAETVGVAGAVSGDDTTTVGDAGDVVVSGVLAPSVTWSSKEYVPVARVLLAMKHVTVLPALWPVPLFTAHCVAGVYGPLLVETNQEYE